MGIAYEGRTIPTSFASCSIPPYFKATLPQRLEAIRNAGFDAVEMSMPDILSYGGEIENRVIGEDDYDAISGVAGKIRILTEQLGLQILMLQPLSRFEGWSKHKHAQEKEAALKRARGWIKIMQALGTDMLQVGSTDSEDASPCLDQHAEDLRELADMLAEKGFRLAYENWCWATHASAWKDVWEISRKADRPNIGLCLDTFQSAGGEYGDPTTESGRIEDLNPSELASRWDHSLTELRRSVPADKIYLLQISDAYRMRPPLFGTSERPRSVWSHDYRPLPYSGGYLPIEDFLGSVLQTGFRGWLSVEVFDSKPKEGMSLEDYTKAAMHSLTRLLVSSLK
ncbi:Xylose isomerase-like, TIM barrel domain protein [Metarhizium rileyi]|uniref:Xylose isomerase-like, TIM barrel domain protein n=1 Tax=Metarhizium rileyi (strain RCEF 4871) TaxID=1649241 RepID=A0A167BQS3_METRR|nr:Xylose isomerase-like, TIM barrel domain protein [Metarhizium rileyi RCEF 4871]